jgi:predicted aspartyl protease
MTGAMGLTYVEGVVTGPTSIARTVRFLVDSGAKYSLLPLDDWRALGLTARRRLTFVLTDGTAIERDVSECYIRIVQAEGHTPVILGEAGDEALLGVVTLEILALVLHPFNRTLQPARLLLA